MAERIPGETVLQLITLLYSFNAANRVISPKFTEYMKISSFNCRNIKSSLPEIRRLCDISDIVFLQETWLADGELHMLGCIDERFYGQGVSAMDTSTQVLRGRPHGGLAILWRKTLKGCTVETLPNPRIMSLCIDDDMKQMKIFNIYMPCEQTDNHDEFLELLCYLRTAAEDSNTPYIAMIGDFNANNTPDASSLFRNTLHRFCNEEKYIISDAAYCSSDTFTFYSEAHQTGSWIDHCVCNQNMSSTIQEISVLYDYVTSDHMPMLVSLDISKVTIGEENDTYQKPTRKIKWHKLTKHDIQNYNSNTEQLLSLIRFNHNLMLCDNPSCREQEHMQSIDRMYMDIIDALKTAGIELQECQGRGGHNIIPGWNDYCREAHSNARDAFLIWVQNGRQRSGPLLRNMQLTRAAFKQALRHCKASESKAHADSLARKLLLKNSKSFWEEIKKMNGKSSSPMPSSVGNASGSEAIAAQWRSHYSQILNSAPSGKPYNDMRDMYKISKVKTEGLTAVEVKNAIADLKCGKACGLDCLTAEHFQYASNRLPVLLSLCFNAMLLHCHIPKCFSDTVLVPILKDKKGVITDVDNYRPIAVTSVASKVFEKIILIRIQDLLCTTDNQFSYKANLSSEMCVFTMKSILDFYITSSSPIYLCFIDSSKAFDRVNYQCLFTKLINRKVPIIIARFFMEWYCTQEFVVRWGRCYSLPFTASNGVRQGGILSPLFFNVYMDELSVTLSNANLGCVMNGVFFNHLMYADDLVVLAPSPRAMQMLLNLCDNFARENHVIYNTRKTVCMCAKPKCFKSVFTPSFELCGTSLRYISSHKYLGVTIMCTQTDDISIGHQCRNTYSRGNTIIRNFSKCTEDVKCQLFQSFCTNFYCASLWCSYRVQSLQSLQVAYNRVFRMLMGLEQRASVSENLINRGLNPFKVILRKQMCSLRKRILQSDNILVATIAESMYFICCKLTRKWNSSVFSLK